MTITHEEQFVVQATDYGVWGDVIREQKSDIASYRYGYQGQFAERDEETGWNHFELREYDPVIGRWTVPDPMRQYWSPYVGMGNDPCNLVDPTGGCTDGNGNPIPCPDGVSDGMDGFHTTILDEIAVTANQESMSFAAALGAAAIRLGPAMGPALAEPTPIGEAIVGAAIITTAIVIHSNSNRNNKPHLVYEIYSIDHTGAERTEKYGITSQEDNVNGDNNRPASQVNRFNRLDPTRAYSWRTVTRTQGRASAKTIEVFMVTKHAITHGGALPPKQIYPKPEMGDGSSIPTFKF